MGASLLAMAKSIYYWYWNYHLFHPHVRILVLFFTHWNFDLILSNIGILALFLQTLEFLYNSSTTKIEILPLSFHTLELLSYFYKHCISPFILPNTRIIALYIYALVFWSYSFKYWNFYFLSFHCKRSNSALGFWPFFIHIGFLIPSF